MAVRLLGAPHAETVLLLLRARGPMRFNAIRRATGLNPNQVDRALEALMDDMHVLPRTRPPSPGGAIFVDYTVTRSGEELAALIDELLGRARARRPRLGDRLIEEIEGLYPAQP